MAHTDTEHDHSGYLDFLPRMAHDEWREAAAKQQAELCREVSNGNP